MSGQINEDSYTPQIAQSVLISWRPSHKKLKLFNWTKCGINFKGSTVYTAQSSLIRQNSPISSISQAIGNDSTQNIRKETNLDLFFIKF